MLSDGRRVFCMLAPTRGQAAARELFRGYSGIVMADRYTVYESLEGRRTRNGGPQPVELPLDGEKPGETVPDPDYLLVACWMDARRGFQKAARHGEAQAEQVLDPVAELYVIEDRSKVLAAQVSDPDERQATLLQARRDLRQGESRPVIERLRTLLDTCTPIDGLPLADAIRWVDNGWNQLTRFPDAPAIPLHSGEAEQRARGPELGRKTRAGSRSEAGTRVAALSYTLVESSKMAGVDARAYLIEATRRLLLDRDDILVPEDYARKLAAPREPTTVEAA